MAMQIWDLVRWQNGNLQEMNFFVLFHSFQPVFFILQIFSQARWSVSCNMYFIQHLDKKKKVGEWLMLYWSSKQELECLTEHLISVIFLEKIPHTHCTRVLTLLACSHGHTKNQSLPLVGWISLNMLNHNYALYVRLECGIFSMFDSTVIKQIYPYDFCDTSNVAAKVLNLYHAWM